MVKVAYTVGRFQPPTIGHKSLIQKVINEAGDGGEGYVFVSAVNPDGVKNVLTADQKLPLLNSMFQKDVDSGKLKFIHTKRDCKPSCGGPYFSFKWLTKEPEGEDPTTGLGYKPADITLVIGKERLDETKKETNEYFGPENTAWGDEKPAKFIPVGESAVRKMDTPASDEANMSGTKARGYATSGDKASFYTALGYDPKTPDPVVDSVYETIRNAVPKKGKKGGADDDVLEDGAQGGPDGEPKTGGRRKTRRARKTRRRSRRQRH
jgi:hypothetical protein